MTVQWTASDLENIHLEFLNNIDSLTAEATNYLCKKEVTMSNIYLYEMYLSNLGSLMSYDSSLDRYINMYIKKIRQPFIKAVISNTIYTEGVFTTISNNIVNLRKYVLKKYGK